MMEGLALNHYWKWKQKKFMFGGIGHVSGHCLAGLVVGPEARSVENEAGN
jgi:hypothetical protein